MNKYGLKNFSNSSELFELNCGSWALDLDYWYLPYESEFNPDECIEILIEEGYTETEITNFLLDEEVDRILSDLSSVRLLNRPSEIQKDEELVAYRIFVSYIEGYGADYDFHFKVFRDGRWQEKVGFNSIRDCDCDFIEPWRVGELIYDSKIIFLAHKIWKNSKIHI